MSDHVWLKNPETGGVWACPVDYLPVALARGWEHSDPPGEEEPAEVPAPASKARKTRKTATAADPTPPEEA